MGHRYATSFAVWFALLALPSRIGANASLVEPRLEDPASRIEPLPPVGTLGPVRPAAVPDHLIAPPPLGAVAVSLHNENTREEAVFVLSPEGEVYGDEDEVARFFRCKRSGRSHPMAPGVLALLASIAQEYPGHVIDVVSGFRRRGAGARRSKHYTGHAIDLRVRGIPSARVRDFLWRTHEEIGLGHYHGQGFLHLDHRPGEDKIGWNQRRGRNGYQYHPGWTKRPAGPRVAGI